MKRCVLFCASPLLSSLTRSLACVTCNTCAQNNFLYRNAGDGQLIKTILGEFVTDGECSIVTGDVDGDGDVDVAGCWLYFNDGTGWLVRDEESAYTASPRTMARLDPTGTTVMGIGIWI